MVMEAFPNAPLKITAKIIPKYRKSPNFGLQLGPRGREPDLPFCIIFVPGAPLGARMGPGPLPRASGTPPDLDFK